MVWHWQSRSSHAVLWLMIPAVAHKVQHNRGLTLQYYWRKPFCWKSNKLHGGFMFFHGTPTTAHWHFPDSPGVLLAARNLAIIAVVNWLHNVMSFCLLQCLPSCVEKCIILCCYILIFLLSSSSSSIYSGSVTLRQSLHPDNCNIFQHRIYLYYSLWISRDMKYWTFISALPLALMP